ncbi:YybH family protein [Devosia lacusdianchii]|uniref:YybH family protein n=1 Tax=Devosia lacusdianchii TaxID=2917991 RepID=UPI001F0620FF|nr:nuclear transport factor 2 family protein [Devosia sp. JXJ CY 41]
MSQIDETQIRSMLEAWAQAVRDIDMDGILANHTEDMVMFDVPVPLQSRGMDAYRKTWDLFFKYSKGGPDSFNLIEIEISAGDDVAFAHGILGIEQTRLRLTVGLRKQNGQWRIAHEHHSYPQEIG